MRLLTVLARDALCTKSHHVHLVPRASCHQRLRRPYSAASMGSTGARMVIKRITMFKVPKDDDIQAVLEAYDVLGKTAKKDGKPYILSHDYGKSINAEDPRNGGFTIIAQNAFASRDDVDFYDRECEAHKKLKMVVGPRQRGMGVQMFESRT